MPEYSIGYAFGGAVVLKDGVLFSIEEIIDELNAYSCIKQLISDLDKSINEDEK